jgi:hypothetical protein
MMTTEANGEQKFTRTVINDMAMAIQRIREVTFLPDKVIIALVDNSLGSKMSIEMLSVILYFKDNMIMPLTWLHEFVQFDEDQSAFIINAPNVIRLTFVDEIESFTFPQNQNRPLA